MLLDWMHGSTKSHILLLFSNNQGFAGLQNQR
jgi:hypothetical protein